MRDNLGRRLTSDWSGPAEVTSHFFRAYRPPAAQPPVVRQRGTPFEPHGCDPAAGFVDRI